jgi:hypothetical protein
MEVVMSLLIVVAGLVVFATISYFLVRSTFSRIENDEWEERYVQMKKDAKLTQSKQMKYGQFQKSKVAG